MIVCLTIRCDWPGCRERLAFDFKTLRPQSPGWKTEYPGMRVVVCPPEIVAQLTRRNG